MVTINKYSRLGLSIGGTCTVRCACTWTTVRNDCGGGLPSLPDLQHGQYVQYAELAMMSIDPKFVEFTADVCYNIFS